MFTKNIYVKFLLFLTIVLTITSCSSDTSNNDQNAELASTSTPLPARTLQQDIKEVSTVEPPEYEQFTERIKEIKITESKSIYDLENEYDTSNRLIELGWNKPTEKSPEFAITDDLNIEALNSVKEGVRLGREYLGNYGPLKVFIIGSDIDKAKIVAKDFCEWAYEDKSMIEHCINKEK